MMMLRRLFVYVVTLCAAAGSFAAFQPSMAQTGRIDTEFTNANSLSDTDFQTNDALEYAGVRSDNASVNGGDVGEISNSDPKALYIEGDENGRDSPVTVFSRDVNTNRASIVGVYFRIKPGDDRASPDADDPGEHLKVDYRDSTGTWVNIETVTPNTDGNYTTFTDTLTTSDAALHDQFSLRFRMDSTTARDPWYIDDMCVLPGGGTCSINNQTPTISDISDQSITENESTGTIGFTVDDPDDAASGLTLQASSSNQTLLPDGNLTLGGSGTSRTVEATPAADESGTATVTVTVDDGTDEISDTFVLSVNDIPRVSTNAGLTLDEGTSKTITTSELAAADDTDGASALTFTVTNGPSNGTIEMAGSSVSSFTQQDLQDGVVSYAHNGSETTSDQITFDLSDDQGVGPSGRTFQITVNPTNDAPSATDDSYSTAEDQSLQVTDPANGVLPNDTDPDDSSLSVQTTPVSGPSNGSVSLNSDGTFTYTPNDDFNGQDEFVYEVVDGNGGTDQATVTITVSAVPDVALVDGRTGSSYNPGAAQPGTNNNPVGRLELSTDAGTATMTSLTVRDNGSPSGVSSLELWTSTDNSFDPGEDQNVASTSYSGVTTFSSLNIDVPSSGIYVFVVVDLASDAGGAADPFLADEADIAFSGGSLSQVNGTETTTFSDAFLSSGSTKLPVELTGFAARSTGRSVVLEWTTASEINNAGFRVETKPGQAGRQGSDAGSASRSTWKTLGTIDGAGTTDEPQSYQYTTDELDIGVHRFRLVQIDASGATHRSEVVTADVSLDGAFELETYPNPTPDRATVKLAVKKSQPVTVAVYNLVGQRVATVHRGPFSGGETQRFHLETDEWPSGVYFVRASGATFSGTRRITVVR